MILGISGSLRHSSYNTALLRAAQRLFPDRIEVATLHGIPLYDGDLEADSGIPPPVSQLKDRIATSAGVLLFTPEYNNSLPGVFKNAVDWLSRPPEDIPRVFHGRPFGVLGASPGNFGTILAQNAWLPVLRTLRTRPFTEGRLMVSGASKLLDPGGELGDEAVLARLRDYLSAFFAFSQA